MVTTTASEIFRFPAGTGTLQSGADADLMVVPDTGQTPAETLLRSRPGDLRLVLVRGKVQLAGNKCAGFRSNVLVEGRPKFVRGRLARLKSRMARRLGNEAHEVTATPLWRMIRSKKESVRQGLH